MDVRRILEHLTGFGWRIDRLEVGRADCIGSPLIGQPVDHCAVEGMVLASVVGSLGSALSSKVRLKHSNGWNPAVVQEVDAVTKPDSSGHYSGLLLVALLRPLARSMNAPLEKVGTAAEPLVGLVAYPDALAVNDGLRCMNRRAVVSHHLLEQEGGPWMVMLHDSETAPTLYINREADLWHRKDGWQ